MTYRNSDQSWGAVSRAFHWAMLLSIAIQVPLGFWMVDVYEAFTETYADDTWVMLTSNWHHTLGFLLLASVCARFSWRVINPVPSLPVPLPLWQRWLARITHAVLYLLLFIYPLSGWAALSAYEGEFPIFFFGYESMPRLVPQVAEGAMFSYEFFAEIHRYCWQVGAALLVLHIGAAIWHHYRANDGVLLRMWNGRSS